MKFNLPIVVGLAETIVVEDENGNATVRATVICVLGTETLTGIFWIVTPPLVIMGTEKCDNKIQSFTLNWLNTSWNPKRHTGQSLWLCCHNWFCSDKIVCSQLTHLGWWRRYANCQSMWRHWNNSHTWSSNGRNSDGSWRIKKRGLQREYKKG